jgi:hypothetical protein
MPYFIRTEENIVDINKSLKRGKSVDGWIRIGKGAWFHLYYSSFNDIKNVMLKVFNQNIEFLPISQKDRNEAYEILINVYGIKHSCSKNEYIEGLSDDVIYRCTHPIYKEIVRNIKYNPNHKEKEM